MLEQTSANQAGDRRTGGSLSIVLPAALIMFCQLPNTLQKREAQKERTDLRKQIFENY